VRSSAGEHSLHTGGVTGSIPVAAANEILGAICTEFATLCLPDGRNNGCNMRRLISRRHLLAVTAAAATAGLMESPGSVRAAGTRILLINPNTNKATTDMMVQIARSAALSDIEIVGATAPRGPLMIIEPEALAASAPQVVELGVGMGKDASGIIISAFGDPGWADLRRQVSIPVVGIAEAAMLAASDNGRRFGVATTTPQLVASIDARAAELGLARLYTGTRVTTEDPNKLVAEPARLVEALRDVVATCIERDKAEAVIIGGGPLGNAAIALTPMFSILVIAPIPAAVHRMLGLVSK
jgi:allantoin racemase